MHYSFVHWPWNVDRDMPDGYWGHGPDVLGSIDLRSIPDQSRRGGTPRGFAFVASTDPLPGSTTFSIGSRLDQRLNETTKRDIEALFGIPDASLRASKTVLDMLKDMLTLFGDPTGKARWKPLMPTRKGVHEIHLGGHSCIWAEKFEWYGYAGDSVRGVLRHDFARHKRECLGVLPFPGWRKVFTRPGWDHYKRVLGALVLKYGVPAEQIIPGETALPPGTQITESWPTNTADITDGSQDLPWSQLAGDFDVVSNKAAQQTTGSDSYARADVDLGSDDHLIQAIVRSAADTANHAPSVFTRKDASATITLYRFQAFVDNDSLRILKDVDGTPSILSTVAFTLAANTDYLLKGDSNGSTQKIFIGGAEKDSVSDPGGITGNFRIGISGFQGTVALTWDDVLGDDGISAVAAEEGGFNRPYARR